MADISFWFRYVPRFSPSRSAVGGRVHLPATLGRREIAELCAAEAWTIVGGVGRWKRITGRGNHLWDCAKNAVHGRHFAPRRGQAASAPRLVAVRAP